MEIPNFDDICETFESDSGYKQRFEYMPDNHFRMLICGPSGSGKTSLLIHMITMLSHLDKLYLYAKNLHQSKYKWLKSYFSKISEKMGAYTLESSTDVIPLSDMDIDLQKLVVFDDFLNDKKQRETINEYFIGGRNKKCSCIYLTQSYFSTPREIHTFAFLILVVVEKFQ